MDYDKQLESLKKACTLCGGYDNLYEAVMVLESSDIVRNTMQLDILDDFYFDARFNSGMKVAEKYAKPELVDVFNDDYEKERYALYDFINLHNPIAFYSEGYEQSIIDYLKENNQLK